MLRMEEQGRRKDTVTADWLARWRLHEKSSNPPYIKRIPNKLECLHRYYMESAYTCARDLRTSENLQETPLHCPPHKYTGCSWTPRLACPKTMAQHWLGSKVEELEGSPSAGKHEMYMVSSYTWPNSYKRATTPYQHGPLRHLPAMCSDWYFGISTGYLWWGTKDTALLENPNC